MKEIPRVPGVYMITCTANNKIYIGSSKDIRNRCAQHFRALSKGEHANAYLQNSWNKHGKGTFTFEVLERCDHWCLLEREQHYLDMMQPFGDRGFNIATQADSCNSYSQAEHIAQLMFTARLVHMARETIKQIEEHEFHFNSHLESGLRILAEWRPSGEIPPCRLTIEDVLSAYRRLYEY